MSELIISAVADFHSHLRQGALMENVVPTIRQGGANLAYVMPNLVPPITSVAQALEYRSQLQKLEPNVTFLMTLYLSPEVTPDTIHQAAKAGIIGVKSYPKGVTTNSDHGTTSYEEYYPVFEAMQECGMVLNLHGEVPCTAANPDTTVLSAELEFLPTLVDLNRRFPQLKIVLEHCTTSQAIATVKKCNENVAGSITAHHLFLTVNDWPSNPFSYCKPVAKLPADRNSLVHAATSGSPKFFLGSDSAPHVRSAKHSRQVAAGVFTQSELIKYVAHIFKEHKSLDQLEKFTSLNGRAFYRIPDDRLEKIRLFQVSGKVVPDSILGDVVPFLAGDEIDWDFEWLKN